MTSSTNQKITASSTGRFSPGDFYADSTLYWISLTPRVWSWNYIFFEVICFWGGGRIVTWLMSSEVFREGLTADQPVNWDFRSADAPERWPAQSHGAFFFIVTVWKKSQRYSLEAAASSVPLAGDVVHSVSLDRELLCCAMERFQGSSKAAEMKISPSKSESAWWRAVTCSCSG